MVHAVVVSLAKPLRMEVWVRLAKELPKTKLKAITTVEPFSRLKELSEQIMAGQIRGRVVVDVDG